MTIAKSCSLPNLAEKSMNSSWKTKSRQARVVIDRKKRSKILRPICSKSRILSYKRRSKSTNRSRWKNKFVRLSKCKWWLKWNRHWAKAWPLTKHQPHFRHLVWLKTKHRILFRTWIILLIQRTSLIWRKRRTKKEEKFPKCRFWIGCPLTGT